MNYRLLVDGDPTAVVYRGERVSLLAQAVGENDAVNASDSGSHRLEPGIYVCKWINGLGPGSITLDTVVDARRRSRRACSLQRHDMTRTLGDEISDALCVNDISDIYPGRWVDIEATKPSASS